MAYRIESNNSRSWNVSLDAYDQEYLKTCIVTQLPELDMLLEIFEVTAIKLSITSSYKVKRIMHKYINEINIKMDRLIRY